MTYHNREDFRLLGIEIAHQRKIKGISQMKLAEEIGISRTHMSNIETAGCAPSLNTVFDIAKALDVPVSKLFDF